MAEVFVRQLIGETRIATVDRGQLTAMEIHRIWDGPPAGAQVAARLQQKSGARGTALMADGTQLLVDPWPTGHSEGAAVQLLVRKAAWREPGRQRLATARLAPTSSPPAAAKKLPPPVAWPDCLDTLWADGWQQAELGTVRFPGGQLLFSPTPALLAVDADGDGRDLCAHAATALARALALWGIGGIVVCDFPARNKADRQAAATAFDAAIGATAHERTGVNGFGLMDIVLPRRGPSILERARLHRRESAALALLWQAAGDPRPGAVRLKAVAAIITLLESSPDLVAEAVCTRGTPIYLAADPMAGEGHVETA